MDLNQFSDVPFWYQDNRPLWCQGREYGDAWWLTAPTTQATVRRSQQLFVESMHARQRQQRIQDQIEMDVFLGRPLCGGGGPC